MPRSTKRPPDTAPLALDWAVSAQWLAKVGERDGRTLAVGVATLAGKKSGWAVFGLDTPADAGSTADVLDDHAHKMIGEYATPGEAFGAAESFARAWLRGFRSCKIERCDCVELDTSEPATVYIRPIGRRRGGAA